MERLDENRLALEPFYFGEGKRNIVATEGDERTIRNVGIDVWRAFFARFRTVEAELSPLNLSQASLVMKRFSTGRFCALRMNGKCLIIGWKSTPILSPSRFGSSPNGNGINCPSESLFAAPPQIGVGVPN